MGDKLPDWATTPKSKGWLVQTAVEYGESTDQVADEKPGFLIGRNGQVVVLVGIWVKSLTMLSDR